MHLLGCTLKEAATAADEHCVSSEDSLVIPILEVETDAVLCVTWRMKSSDLNGTDLESLLVCGSLVNQMAVVTADDGEIVVLELR